MKNRLIQKAKQNELNVEDIIELSATRNPEISMALQEIKAIMNWPNKRIEMENGRIIPPMGMWADVASEYIKNGYDGLYKLSQHEEKVYFIISFLQVYKTTDSVTVLLKISDFYSPDSNAYKEILLNIVSGLNLILSFPGAPEIEEIVYVQARELIHKVLSLCDSQVEYAATLCALRGVGDEDSIKLISKVPKLTDSWTGIEDRVKRAIKKRTKNITMH